MHASAVRQQAAQRQQAWLLERQADRDIATRTGHSGALATHADPASASGRLTPTCRRPNAQTRHSTLGSLPPCFPSWLPCWAIVNMQYTTRKAQASSMIVTNCTRVIRLCSGHGCPPLKPCSSPPPPPTGHDQQPAMERFLAQEIESHACPVCFELMLAPVHAPMLLFPCGHTFCSACLEPRGGGNYTARLSRCPHCREAIEKRAVNVALQQLIQSLAAQRDASGAGAAHGGGDGGAPAAEVAASTEEGRRTSCLPAVHLLLRTHVCQLWYRKHPAAQHVPSMALAQHFAGPRNQQVLPCGRRVLVALPPRSQQLRVCCGDLPVTSAILPTVWCKHGNIKLWRWLQDTARGEPQGGAAAGAAD
jgi:RING-type zinc-finger